MTIGIPATALALVACWLNAVPEATAGTARLANERLTVDLGERGLMAVSDPSRGAMSRFGRDDFAIAIDGTTYSSTALPVPARRVSADRITFAWQAGPYRIDVVYELKPGWAFISKQLLVYSPAARTWRVDAVRVFEATLLEAPHEAHVPRPFRENLGLGAYGCALRFAGGHGLLAVVQNPFLDVAHDRAAFSIGYRPDMEWRQAYGPFASDRGLIAPYRLSGRRLPARMLPEWRLGENEAGPGADEAEVQTFASLVRAFLVHKPVRPLNIFVGWTANDYQIDIATEEGRAEYRRLMDRAAELGANHVLFAPTNSALARRVDSVDDWSWENLLWLGLGQKIRRNEWDPRNGEIPATVQQMLDHARTQRLGLVAYVYPVVAFSQRPEWLVTRRNAPGSTRKYASLAFRSLQDWLIDTLVAFQQRTGVSGYSFDHTFLGLDGPGSYAQWWGWRRVMETLRQRIPELVIDGRQAYHLYGPWGWLAGSYPHPTYHDEQPESFVPFPDLSFDRVSAARQRYTAFRYRNHDFAPAEIMPGFITHQTPRLDGTGDMPQTKTGEDVVLHRFRARDWDSLGWRYSLLSSIATAGWNNVINMIPARDPEEYRHFGDADKAWFRKWLLWTDTHREILRHTRTILGQPAVGRVDGTAAISGSRGFIFLFNPNARRLRADFTLDASVGLEAGGSFVLREIHPLEGRAIGKPGAGVWSHGDAVSMELAGHAAVVLSLEPAADRPGPLVFNAPGGVSVSGGDVALTGVRGEVGTTAQVLVTVPTGQPVTSLRVNGRGVPFARLGRGLVAADVRFAGYRFSGAQQVGEYDASFAGGRFAARFVVPDRVVRQLEARHHAYPIPWTPDDYGTPWLAPHRQILYVQIAEPDDRWEPVLRIDGQPIHLHKAYTALRPVRETFVGFYADLSLLAADTEHSLELDLPVLRPGQFQGLFFTNVEPEYTSELAP